MIEIARYEGLSGRGGLGTLVASLDGSESSDWPVFEVSHGGEPLAFVRAEPGHGPLSGVYALGKGASAVLVVMGASYFVQVSSGKVSVHCVGSYCDAAMVSSDDQYVALAGAVDVIVVDAAGGQTVSPRLASDGIQLKACTPSTIEGEGWNAPFQEWRSFEGDLATKIWRTAAYP